MLVVYRDLSTLSQSFSDHHLRCGGWLNLEFSKGKTFGIGHYNLKLFTRSRSKAC